jgi:GTP-binding protein
MTQITNKIRNVAIIAHVDHGKTTLVDGLLKQSHTFRDNQSEMQQTAILDTGDLERERGITISAKTIAVTHEGFKINIIDTPGHADFSGEVERTLNLADGCLLIVDAQEGPMPQTKFVLTRALALGLKPIVVVNKIDKRDRRIDEVVDEVGSLFLDLAINDDQLEFPIYYAIGRDGKSWDHVPTDAEIEGEADLEPIFNSIITEIPVPRVDPDGPFQMLVTSLTWDSFLGKYTIGRIQRGSIKAGQALTLIDRDGKVSSTRADKLFVAQGLDRVEVTEAVAGDIVWITGIGAAAIGATVTAVEAPHALPVMEIEAPTLQIRIGPNTSPFAGREGKFTTSRQIGARLERELETNVGLRVVDRGSDFLVSGRGELHLSVLIETLRREGFELEVSRPQVVTKLEEGKTLEPVEELTVEVPEEYVGAVTAELGRRRGEMVTMEPTTKATIRLIFRLPTRTLLGLRNILLTATKGTAIVNSLLIGYEPLGVPLIQLRNGVLISAETGSATIYSLKTVEERGTAYIGPSTKVYEGMIIGLNRRGDDMEINVTKEKKLTNVRASSTDMTTQLTPYTDLTLEEALDFIENDELLEITPVNIRMRKRYLLANERKRHRNQAIAA